MPAVIFDLDGTLADTSADLIAAANASCAELGHGPLLDAKADALTAFHGGRAMLRLGFSRLGKSWDEAGVDACYPRFLDHYAEGIDRHTRPYPGVEAALDRLLGLGLDLAICTNKPEALAETLMQRLGLRDRFGALVGADTLPVRKPDPAPYHECLRRLGRSGEASFLVGDTVTDRDTARAAGVPVVLVAFGPEGADVARFEPDAMLQSYADLHSVTLRLIRE
ncbi:MAG: HAD-IA family hydrolase [Paracoccaceae bacterium]